MKVEIYGPRQKSAWYMWKVCIRKWKEVKQDKEKEAKAIAAFKASQMKNPAKIMQAARAPARRQPTRTTAMFVHTPTSDLLPQFCMVERNNFQGEKKQLFVCVNGPTSWKHFLQLYPYVIELLQSNPPPAGSLWAKKTHSLHLLAFADCCSSYRACTLSSWLPTEFCLPFSNKLLEYYMFCLGSSKDTLMSPFSKCVLAFTVYATWLTS